MLWGKRFVKTCLPSSGKKEALHSIYSLSTAISSGPRAWLCSKKLKWQKNKGKYCTHLFVHVFVCFNCRLVVIRPRPAPHHINLNREPISHFAVPLGTPPPAPQKKEQQQQQQQKTACTHTLYLFNISEAKQETFPPGAEVHQWTHQNSWMWAWNILNKLPLVSEL